MRKLIPPIITGTLLAIVTIASAQDQCAALVQEAVSIVADTCVSLGRNEVCNGYFRVDAQPREAASAFNFTMGDVVDVTDIASVHTYPFNAVTNEWGIALMNLQANLPDELPGANVTFLLLGDTDIVDESGEGQRPMQTLRLETGIMGTTCSEAPSNGLLIQTPHGFGRVTLNINNVDISLGSTVFVESHANDVMTVSTLEGAAYVSLHGMNQTALPGYAVHIALDEDMNPLGFVGPATPYQQNVFRTLPLSLLERPIDIVTLLNSPVEEGFGAPPVTASNYPLEAGGTTGNTINTVQGVTGNCGVGVGDGAATCEAADANRQNDTTPASNNSGSNNAGGNGKGNSNH